MGAASSIVFNQYTGAFGQNFNKGAMDYVCGTATFPSGVATCTIANIPNLTGYSVVKIMPTQAGLPLGEIGASRTTGNQGTITIGTLTGGNTAATQTFAFEKWEP